MADHEDETMRVLAETISATYTLLISVCELLPVPIGLPNDQHTPAADAIPAIQRVVELAKDQPMGELQEMQLYTGCIHLLAAMDLYGLCITRYTDTRAEGVGLNLLRSEEVLKTLEVWLLINQAD